MSENALVPARIDEHIKNEAATVLKAMGLTISDAFRTLLVRAAKEKALPFEPLTPNAGTIEAMKAARRGELFTVGKPRKLTASLNEDRFPDKTKGHLKRRVPSAGAESLSNRLRYFNLGRLPETRPRRSRPMR